MRLYKKVRKVDFSYLFSVTIIMVCLIMLLIKAFVLDFIPAFLPNVKFFGSIVESIVLNIIASAIFFIMFSYTVDKRNKSKIRIYIEHQTNLLTKCGENLLWHISEATNTQLCLKNILAPDVQMLCAKIDAEATPPKLFNPHEQRFGTWFDLIYQETTKTKSIIRKLVDRSIYIDADRFSQIVELEDCQLISHVETVINLPGVRNYKISAFHKDLINFFDILNRIKSFD